MLAPRGLAVAVADAHPAAAGAAHWVTPSHGGHGAVREVCDLLLSARAALTRRLTAALIGVAGHALLYGLLAGRDDRTSRRGDAADERGYYLTDATLTEMGPDGTPRIVCAPTRSSSSWPTRASTCRTSPSTTRTKDSGNWT